MPKPANQTEEFRFDPELHEYWLGSRRMDHVTGIIKKAGLVYDYHDQQALERGKVVDQCCTLLDLGRLDWAEVDERIVGYVLSYEKFLDHTGFRVRGAQVSLYDPELLFAGTFDVNFETNWLFDRKAGHKAKWHPLQTAAYKHLSVPEAIGKKGRRGSLYLRADGELPRLEEHRDPDDWKAFLTCLNYVRVKEKYGS